MSRKYEEYNRGRQQGLAMAKRVLLDAGEKKAAALIDKELRLRGGLPVQIPVTVKEMDEALQDIKLCMYETFLCQTLMVLHDQFDFGSTRCLRFMKNWNLKTDCMQEGLVTWKEKVEWVSEYLKIDLPTKAMKAEGLI